jgi:hypothetical protein
MALAARRMWVVAPFAVLLPAAVGCGSDARSGNDCDAFDEACDAGEPADPQRIWKAVLMAGDDRIPAFDNAREAIADLIMDDGVSGDDTIQLSRDPNESSDGVRRTSIANLEASMLELRAGEGDACFVFMTSHGNAPGFFIPGDGFLMPSKLDQILDDACGPLPTVALISACYSGIFLDPLSAPNRIVLTASRADRASFGCTSEATYTNWDECVIMNWRSADTWDELYEAVERCIQAKEMAGGFTPSLPQAFFGDELSGLRILNR